MKKVITDILICSECLPKEYGLKCDIQVEQEGDIISGTLICPRCSRRYHIIDGTAFLVPENRSPLDSNKYEQSDVAASYLWSHYADLAGDNEAATAYIEWAGFIENKSGFALDAGCSVGRFAFEMSRKADFVIGLDYSAAFIRIARQIMSDGNIRFYLSEEGNLKKEYIACLPDTCRTDNVEFIVADAQRLPFPSGSFSIFSSLNLVDKVPFPVEHLREINRTCKSTNTCLLLSDPFSWSKDIANQEDWLGGTPSGPFAGKGIDNITKILTGNIGYTSHPWSVENKGHVWWKIRNHSNHFELIRSWYLKTKR